MVVLSLVVSVVAVVVAVLALRRADVVERRLNKRLASAGRRADDRASGPQVVGSETETADAQIQDSSPRTQTSGTQTQVGDSVAGATYPQTQGIGSVIGRFKRSSGKTAGEDFAGDDSAGGLTAAEPAGGDISGRDQGTAETAELLRRITALESRALGGISRVAVVRYDAFEGSGGLLSYSVALVDDQGRGLVLTAIHSQAETRTYVKEVPQSEDMERPAELSPEEREVLRKAVGSRAESQSDRKKLGRKRSDRKSAR